MTVSQNDLLNDLESKVRRLMSLYDNLKREKEDADEALTKCEADLRQSRASEKMWRDKYQHLLIAKTISSSEEDSKKTMARLSKLEREIEKCIALLNQ